MLGHVSLCLCLSLSISLLLFKDILFPRGFCSETSSVQLFRKRPYINPKIRYKTIRHIYSSLHVAFQVIAVSTTRKCLYTLYYIIVFECKEMSHSPAICWLNAHRSKW